MYELRQDVNNEPILRQKKPQTLLRFEVPTFAQGVVATSLLIILIVSAVPYLQ